MGKETISAVDAKPPDPRSHGDPFYGARASTRRKACERPRRNLLDDLACETECDILSDLRCSPSLCGRIGRALESMELETYDLASWNEAAMYLTGIEVRFDSRLAAAVFVARRFPVSNERTRTALWMQSEKERDETNQKRGTEKMQHEEPQA